VKALKWLRGWRKSAPAAPVRPAVTAPKDAPRVNWLGLIAKVLADTESAKQPARRVESYRPAPGVVPEAAKKRVFAMDATPYEYMAQQQGYFGYSVENTFPGYPYLAQLAQLPEYRKITCTIAKEMTRKWLKLRSEGEGDDKAEKLQKLEAAMVRFKVRQAFRRMAEHDGFFGRGQLYIDLRKPGGAPAREDENELQTPLVISPAKIKKGSLIGFRVVEPVWMYPGLYNSTQPLAGDFYKPSTWYVMGKIVHASRFVIMMARPVPDLLKAAYSFGGVSLSQLARPYIDNWLRTRDSVSDLVHNFSITGLATDMQAALLAPNLEGESGQGLINRMKFFNAVRDNRGLMLTDKEKEEFFQFNTPLSGLDQLQAQAQEQMAAVSSIPLVKLLGITPAGLNANSDGEIRVFYDDIHAEQENSFRDEFKKILDVLQLNEFGEIDPDITFEFEPLYQLSSLEKANERKASADTDQVLIDAGVISAQEARARVANDPESPYTSLEVTDEDDLDPDDIGEEGDQADRADTQRQGAAAG
jgi:phage-related protein (TIGR01555 family)